MMPKIWLTRLTGISPRLLFPFPSHYLSTIPIPVLIPRNSVYASHSNGIFMGPVEIPVSCTPLRRTLLLVRHINLKALVLTPGSEPMPVAERMVPSHRPYLNWINKIQRRQMACLFTKTTLKCPPESLQSCAIRNALTSSIRIGISGRLIIGCATGAEDTGL